jgi:dienelactone hydrolase
MVPAREASRSAGIVTLGAFALVAVGLAGGALVRLTCAALAVLLVALALRAWRAADAQTARRISAAGVGSALLGAAWILTGSPGAGLVTLAAAVATAWAGARLALALGGRSDAAEAAGVGVLAATALDEATLWLRELRARRGMPAIDTSLCRTVLDRQRERGGLDEPERAHPVPPPLEKAVLEAASAPGLGAFESLAFESEWQPTEPELRDAWRAAGESRIARAWLWRATGALRPALLLVPGHGGGRVDVDARLTAAARLSRDLDIDVLLPVLPFHGGRAAPGRAGFLHCDPLWVSAAIGQAVWELRRLAGWLRAQGAPALGVAGVGVGGTLAALLASLDGALACAVPAFAPLSPRSLCAEGRLDAWAAGAGEDVVEALLSLCSPLRLAPRAPAAGRLVVGARADRFVPAEETQALAAHWQAPLLWAPGGHVVPGSPRRLREEIAEHLRRTLCARPTAHEVPLSHFRM